MAKRTEQRREAERQRTARWRAQLAEEGLKQVSVVVPAVLEANLRKWADEEVQLHRDARLRKQVGLMIYVDPGTEAQVKELLVRHGLAGRVESA